MVPIGLFVSGRAVAGSLHTSSSTSSEQLIPAVRMSKVTAQHEIPVSVPLVNSLS
jgi:hypothetical protein